MEGCSSGLGFKYCLFKLTPLESVLQKHSGVSLMCSFSLNYKLDSRVWYYLGMSPQKNFVVPQS